MARQGFTFAGFKFPRPVATLPAGSPQSRLSELRKRGRSPCGPYSHAPTPNASGRGFYHASFGEPCTRIEFADDVARIGHKGWFCDSFESEVIRGIVARLPHGRYAAGWSMGEGMCAELGGEVFDNLADAARDADEQARIAAEHEREDSERFDAMTRAESESEDADSDLSDAWEDYRAARAAMFADAAHGPAHDRAAARVRYAIARCRTARRDLARAQSDYERGD